MGLFFSNNRSVKGLFFIQLWVCLRSVLSFFGSVFRFGSTAADLVCLVEWIGCAWMDGSFDPCFYLMNWMISETALCGLGGGELCCSYNKVGAEKLSRD